MFIKIKIEIKDLNTKSKRNKIKLQKIINILFKKRTIIQR